MDDINKIIYEAIKSKTEIDAKNVEYIYDNFVYVSREILDQDRWNTYIRFIYKLEYNGEVLHYALKIWCASTEYQHVPFYDTLPKEVQFKEVTDYKWVDI